MRFSITIINLSLMVLSACGPDLPPNGGKSEPKKTDNWLVYGKVSTKGFATGEMVAIGMDGNSFRSHIADDQSFGIELPGNSTYAVYFVPSNPSQDKAALNPSDNVNTAVGERKFKPSASLLTFEESNEIGMRNTLRLPKVIGKNELDLGEVDIKNQAAFPTINPATVLDFDSDGINDFSDTDDQNDGLSDKMQKDMTERVQICHMTSKTSGVSENVPLSALFDHMEHGDNMGPCQNGAQAKPAPNNDNNQPNNLPISPGPDSGKGRNSGAVIERTPDEPGEEKTDAQPEDKKDEGNKEPKPEDGQGEDKKPEDNKDDNNDEKNPGDNDNTAPKKPRKPKKPSDGKKPGDEPRWMY